MIGDGGWMNGWDEGQGSEIGGQGSDVRGQMSDVGSQGSGVRGLGDNWDDCGWMR